jgi:hypothetical protein
MEVKTQWPGAWAVKQDDRSSGLVPEPRAGLSRHPSFEAQTIDADIGFGLPLQLQTTLAYRLGMRAD